MMRLSLLTAVLLFAQACCQAAQPVMPFESSSEHPATQLDSFVFGKLRELGIQPAMPCSDAVFLRRAFMDVIGTLPTPQEAVEFLSDSRPNKRAMLVDRLLERPEFTDYWGMKWCDLLRVKSEFPVNLWPDASQAYDHWIRACIRANTPYSQMVWALLTANGSNFRNPEVNFYRSAGSKDPKAIARIVALAFMGERVEHWSAAKLGDMGVFFSQIGYKSTGEWKEEIVYYKGVDETNHSADSATLPDGSSIALVPGKDPREIFASWLISSPYSPFARNAVNRVWFWLFGRGIVQEPDDFRADNPPANPQLLDWLAREFQSSNYDVKQLLRLILNSNTYQLSSIPASKDPRAEANFAYYPTHRLDAEVIIDVINKITGSHDDYSSQIPEPYTFVPDQKKAVALPDGSITSAFLELYGRPPRDTGLLSERNNHSTAGQRLTLLNSSQILNKLMKSDQFRALIQSSNPPEKTIEQIYLILLSRYPTANELQTAKSYSQSSEAKGSDAFYDVAWALMNSSEFLYHH